MKIYNLIYLCLILLSLNSYPQTVVQQFQKIIASDRALNINYGRPISVSGNYAIVGTELENRDASGGNAIAGAGVAYIYERNPVTGV
jgi:hypothetical protein